MILTVKRKTLQIEPAPLFDQDGRNLDIAFIEEVLGLKEDGDSIKLVRKNAHGLSCIAYLVIEKKEAV